MKRFVLAPLFLSCLLLSACGKYGSGETVGYVYVVDDGLFWDHVWYKSSLEAAESDCYVLKNDNLKQQLRELVGATKIRLHYDRHLITGSLCGPDAITSFELPE